MKSKLSRGLKLFMVAVASLLLPVLVLSLVFAVLPEGLQTSKLVLAVLLGQHLSPEIEEKAKKLLKL